MNNIIISPSLLSCDFLNIESELFELNKIENIWLHLDIMDGHFVPNLTFGHPIIKLISTKTQHPLDAHFMVTNPEFYIDTLKDYGLFNFTFHAEATSEEETLRLVLKAKQYFPSVGISIRPQTALQTLSENLLKNINLLLIMSVEPGFGGQSFIENSYQKITQAVKLRQQLATDFSIQVDGGVSEKNAKELISHGAINLVAGSYIFKDGPGTYEKKVNSLLDSFII